MCHLVRVLLTLHTRHPVIDSDCLLTITILAILDLRQLPNRPWHKHNRAIDLTSCNIKFTDVSEEHTAFSFTVKSKQGFVIAVCVTLVHYLRGFDLAGSSMILRNVYEPLPGYMAAYPRRYTHLSLQIHRCENLSSYKDVIAPYHNLGAQKSRLSVKA
jgi:hypothetical protein